MAVCRASERPSLSLLTRANCVASSCALAGFAIATKIVAANSIVLRFLIQLILLAENDALEVNCRKFWQKNRGPPPETVTCQSCIGHGRLNQVPNVIPIDRTRARELGRRCAESELSRSQCHYSTIHLARIDARDFSRMMQYQCHIRMSV